MSLKPSLRWRAALSLVALAVALFVAGCANMPLNLPSAISPASHGTVETP